MFRTEDAFKSLDGKRYSGGWIWGEDGADISFSLDGAYDLFSGVFSVRRDDEEEAGAHLEIYGDGELLYESEPIVHPEPVSIPVSVDVAGCGVLRIAFVCDYEVNAAERGYCYHGLGAPTLTKTLPAEEKTAGE